MSEEARVSRPTEHICFRISAKVSTPWAPVSGTTCSSPRILRVCTRDLNTWYESALRTGVLAKDVSTS
eukprot:2207909-Pyramimonas_sp.AAC.1